MAYKMLVDLLFLIAVASTQVPVGGSYVRTFCGQNLPEALASYFCDPDEVITKRQSYNPIPNTIMHVAPTKMKKNMIPNDPIAAVVVSPWLPKASALGQLTSRRKRSHGVVDECCIKPCYLEELLTYC